MKTSLKKSKKFFNNIKIIIKLNIILLLLMIYNYIENNFLFYINKNKNYYYINKKYTKSRNYLMDNITLVSAYFNITSKHKYKEYLEWTNNLLKINASMVFFIDKSMINIIRKMRPKEYENKTIWIPIQIKDFYTFKHFNKDFIETHKIDIEKRIHNVPLYLIWAEKCKFLEKAVINNYFNSKCFYWIDAGYFRDSRKIKKYLNNWPSTKNCFKDPRVIFNVLRNISKSEIEGLTNFNKSIHKEFQKKINVGGNMFGGQAEYIKTFSNLYYNTIKLFIKKKIFIGKDQNLFALIVFLHPETFKLVYSHSWKYFQDYFL